MRKILLVIVLLIILINNGFSQLDNYEHFNNNYYLDENVQANSLKIAENQKDSIWTFYPFTINLSAGVFVPLGRLSEYFNPCAQIGFGFGLMLNDKMRIEYTVIGRFMNGKESFEINVDNSVEETSSSSGGSIGGWLTYELYGNKNIMLELTSGISWEPLTTEIKDPDDSDEYLDVSTIGFSVGLNSWINKFGKQNIGISLWYNYASYRSNELLKSNIGGHYLSASLILRLPSRKKVHRIYE